MTQKDCKETIDLFLYEEDGKSHYCFISSFNRFFRSQITLHTQGITNICKKCFTYFTKQEIFEKHVSYYCNDETVAVKMPSKKKTQISKYTKETSNSFCSLCGF